MTHSLHRRNFLKANALVAIGALAEVSAKAGDKFAPKKILLRSSWQTVNIGDIAHTPGMLVSLERYFPQAEITLWPSQVSNGVEEMLKARFPKLRIATSTDEKRRALDECDFCLHGSGPGFVGGKDVAKWQATGKPYGIGGITLSADEIKTYREVLAGAKFIFFRDTKSLEGFQSSGINVPTIGFGPDATFHLDLKAETKAQEFLHEQNLSTGQFACFVPRLRYTPYWKEGRKYAPGEIERRDAVNNQFVESDHAKLRTAIVAWVRETKLKALLCPEMTYQVDLLRPLLFDALPEDVKSHVVVRPTYWLPNEAASTYACAAAVVSCEMHSPIIAIANSTPAIHVRQPTDTSKGQMWRDVGLGDWLFEIDSTTGDQIASQLLQLHRNQAETKNKVKQAQAFVAEKTRVMMKSIGDG